MALKTIVDAEGFEQLPDALKEFYSQDGDSFVLSTDSTNKINEFRSNNRNLYNENEELKKKQTDIENQLKQFQEKNKVQQEKELLSEGKVDELLDQRTEAMRQSYEQKINELAKNHQNAEQALDIHIVENQIRDAAIKANAKNDRAVDHIIRAVRPHVKRDGANAIRVDKDGNSVMTSDGKTPQGILDVVEELKSSDSFLFAESTGSGASGGQTDANTAKKKIRRSEIGKYISEVSKGEVEIVDG